MMTEKTTTTGWRAPSNIALVKYWGKRTGQLPVNGSISITLDQSFTTTWLSFRKKAGAGHSIDMEYFFHGNTQLKFSEKIAGYLNTLQPELPFLTDYQMVFNSENSFPHSAGIASSASSMAALALCLLSMEELVTGKKLPSADFFRRASALARQGSGSASRSVYGGIVSWGKISSIEDSSDEYATPFLLPSDSRLRLLRDSILVVSPEEKALSSSAGHASMISHPFREGRIEQANCHVNKMTEAIRGNNFRTIAEISEKESLALHALLLSSASGVILLKPNTLRIIEEIVQFRKSTNLDLFFSIDAGPNVHLIYYEDQKEMILPFIRQNLSKYCEQGEWIDDRIGQGPVQLNAPTEN
jgi:diphosphomevalonate decarboxylase